MVKIFRDIPRECRHQPVAKTLADDLTGERFTNITLPNGSKRGVNGAKALAKVVIDYLLKEYFDDCMEFVHTNKPIYITFDKDRGKCKDKAGSVSVCFQSKDYFMQNVDFYFISNASYRDVGKNLARLIDGTHINPRDFIIV